MDTASTNTILIQATATPKDPLITKDSFSTPQEKTDDLFYNPALEYKHWPTDKASRNATLSIPSQYFSHDTISQTRVNKERKEASMHCRISSLKSSILHPEEYSQNATTAPTLRYDFTLIAPMRHPQFLSFLQRIEHQWNRSPLSRFTNHRLGAASTNQGCPQPDPIEARMNQAKHYFENIKWQPQSCKLERVSCFIGDTDKSTVPAIHVQNKISVEASVVTEMMQDYIDHYQNWLPIMDTMSVVSKDSDQTQFLMFKTHRKFGIGGRSGLCEANFRQNQDQARILIEQLPSEHPLYEAHKPRGKQVAHFLSYMEFNRSKDDPSVVELAYYNHTDPALRAPKGLMLSEIIHNHTTFVATCSKKLVESQD